MSKSIKIHDQRTGIEPTLGFSIKSQLGGKSTLLNASKITNFQYEIADVELSTAEIDEINAISSRSKIRDRIAKIKSLGGSLQFAQALNPIFRNNLTLIDSNLPKIIAEALLLFFEGQGNFLKDVVGLLDASNPLGYDMSTGHNYYEYKIKRLLWEVALGMMPKQVWSGTYDATGGYLVVKTSGEIVCYHIYNKNEFEDYLFYNTKFETASSSRNDFGTVYSANGSTFFNLNLQIRFS